GGGEEERGRHEDRRFHRPLRKTSVFISAFKKGRTLRPPCTKVSTRVSRYPASSARSSARPAKRSWRRSTAHRSNAPDARIIFPTPSGPTVPSLTWPSSV